jgi:hypothetical protein
MQAKHVFSIHQPLNPDNGIDPASRVDGRGHDDTHPHQDAVSHQDASDQDAWVANFIGRLTGLVRHIGGRK